MKEDLFIITGAAGFLGNNLVLEINRESPESRVIAVCHPNDDLNPLSGLECDICTADVLSLEQLVEAFGAADSHSWRHIYIVHCAGIVEIRSKPNPLMEKVNIQGTRNVIQAAKQLSVSKPHVRMVYVGSVHAIPVASGNQIMREVDHFDPALVEGQYAKSKAQASQEVLNGVQEGLDALIVEPSGIIGPRNSSPENMKELVREVAKGKLRICVPGGYNFVDVRDVAAGILAACKKGHRGASYILSGHYTTMLDLCQTVCALSHREPIRTVIPLWVAKLAAPVCELYYSLRRKTPLFTAYALYTVNTNARFDHGRAEAALRYTPRPLGETLRDMLEWMEQQPDW